LALEVLQSLSLARLSSPQGLGITAIANELHIEQRHAQPVLEALQELNWVGRLEQASTLQESAWVLLVDMDSTPLEPLVKKLCLHASDTTALLWEKAQLSHLKLADVIKT
jgi:membrane protein